MNAQLLVPEQAEQGEVRQEEDAKRSSKRVRFVGLDENYNEGGKREVRTRKRRGTA